MPALLTQTELAELVGDPGEHVLDVPLVADVGGDHQRPPSVLADPVGDVVADIARAHVDHDVGTGAGEAGCGGSTDARAGSRHQGDLAVQRALGHRAPHLVEQRPHGQLVHLGVRREAVDDIGQHVERDLGADR